MEALTGEKLRRLILSSGMTLAQAAGVAGIPPPAMSLVVQGKLALIGAGADALLAEMDARRLPDEEVSRGQSA